LRENPSVLAEVEQRIRQKLQAGAIEAPIGAVEPEDDGAPEE
jgi:hypothetical protein